MKTQVATPSRREAPKGAPTQQKTRKAKGLFSGIGGMLGTGLGGPSGGIVGAAAGDLLGNLFGFGDYDQVPPVPYSIENNTTIGMQTPMAAQIPLMHGGDGTCRIAKREYIGDVTMTESFGNVYYKINPTNSILFPWLSVVAKNFEQFKFLGLTFAFRSLTANALGIAGAPSMGSITLATEYDVNAVPCTSKPQANSMLFATSCKPADSMLHPIECDPDMTPSQPLYTGSVLRVAGVTNDQRLETMGYIQVITQGAPIAGGYKSAGELWVTYDVMLLKPLIAQRTAFESMKTFKDGGRVTADATTSSIDARFLKGGDNYVFADLEGQASFD